MDLKNISLVDLSIYANKLGVYVNDIKQMLERLAFLKSKVKYFDQNKEKETVLLEKIQKAQDLFNAIQIEIESRALENLKFDFEYDKLTTIQIKINNAYQAEIRKPQEK